MRNKILITLITCLFTYLTSNAQDTRIPFDSGVLKLFSSKNFIIKGYDGKEVIIKSLHSNNTAMSFYNRGANSKETVLRSTRSIVGVTHEPHSKRDSTSISFFYKTNAQDRSEGLKKLGKKAAAEESGIYLHIEQKGDQLIIRDNIENMLVMISDERYEISIPNSIKLDWDTNGYKTDKHMRFFTSNASELRDFNGEVEITSTLNNIKLTDVSGPVTINTIGGNVTAKFDKTIPNKLYSVYSNNGFIDITLPANSNVNIDATADEILSNLDFDILSDLESEQGQQMNLKLGSGKVKMKLDAGYGNIYLRKKL